MERRTPGVEQTLRRFEVGGELEPKLRKILEPLLAFQGVRFGGYLITMFGVLAARFRITGHNSHPLC